MSKKWVFIFFCLVSSFPIKSQEYNSARVEVNIYPELDLVNTISLGEKMYSKEVINYKRAALLKDTIFVKSNFERGFIIPGQILYLRENDNWIQYISNNNFGLLKKVSFYKGEPLICVNKKNNLVEKISYSIYPINKLVGPQIKNTNPIILEKNDIVDEGEINYQKKILFSGYSNFKIKLKYLEFTQNKSVPDSYLDLEYDLSENRFIFPMGMKIEILKCNSFNVIYKILSDI